MPTFARHIGIDYSGAETPTSSLKGLRVYLPKAMRRPQNGVPGLIRSSPAKDDLAPCNGSSFR